MGYRDIFVGDWCNGSTPDFESGNIGSIPCYPTKILKSPQTRRLPRQV